MRNWRMPLGLLALAASCMGTSSTPALAGVDVDFGANVRVGDNTDLFFNISSRYFGRERPVVDDWGRRFPNPDDLSVFLFLAQRSGRSPEMIFSLRRQGLSWWDVGVRVGVPVDVWFVPVEVDPGPPYGKAYGYWRKHKGQPATRVALRDDDCRNLVAVRMIHEYYGVPAETAMQWRASRRDVRTLMAEEYDRRHGKGMRGSVNKPHSDRRPHSDKKSRNRKGGHGHH